MSQEDSSSVKTFQIDKYGPLFYETDTEKNVLIESFLDLPEDCCPEERKLNENPIPHVRICKKNRTMISKAKRLRHQSTGVAEVLFSDSDDPDYIPDNGDDIKDEIFRESIAEFSLNKVKLEPASCFMLYIVSGKSIRDIIPDHEISQTHKIFSNLLSKMSDCHEAHFGLGKLYTHLGRMDKAIFHLKEAAKLNQSDDIYKIWYSLVQSKSFCSTKGEALTCKSLLDSCIETIETLWGLLNLSFTNLLDSAKEIELPQFYATKIKDIDLYYGYLAWSEIFIRENQTSKAKEVLKALIQIYPFRPEAYVRLWEFYYKNHQYDGAEEIAAIAFSYISASENLYYNIILCIRYAKTLFRQNKFRECFQVLQQHYLDYPNYTVLLYQYGKLIVKAQDYTCIGSAIGALEESIKLCDEFRYGSIYFWLAKAYRTVRQSIEEFYAMKNSLKYLETSEMKKVTEMKDHIRSINESMTAYETIEKSLGVQMSDEEINNCKSLCEDVKNFQKQYGELLMAKILWCEGNQKESIKLLQNSVKWSNGRMIGYFQLMKYLKIIGDYQFMKMIGKEMVLKCKNNQIPTFIWMEAHIIYAKILVLVDKPAKAITLLKCLAQVLPPIPDPSLFYTNNLQKATTLQQLLSAASRAVKSASIFNYNMYKNISHVPQVISEQNKPKSPPRKTKRLTDDIIFNSPISPKGEKSKTHRRVGTFSERFKSFGNHKRFESLMINTELASDQTEMKLNPEKNDIPLVSPSKISNSYIGLSICSDTNFLYKIGKIAGKFKVYMEDGLCAIDDYLLYLRYEKNEEKQDMYRTKAMYWKAVLLLGISKYNEAVEVFKEIYGDLQRFGMGKKLSHAKEFCD